MTPISLYTADDAWYTCNLFTYLAAGYAGVDALNKGGDINTEQMKAGSCKAERVLELYDRRCYRSKLFCGNE